MLTQRLKAVSVTGNVIGVVEILADDDVHHRQRQRQICARMNRQIPIRAACRARGIGIDHHQLAALAARFFDEGPEVNIVGEDVGSPHQNQARVAELFGFGADLAAKHRDQSGLPGGRADGAVELRCAQTMEEAAIHRGIVQRAQGAAVGERKNRLRPKFAGNLAETRHDLAERLIPGDAHERVILPVPRNRAGLCRTLRLDPAKRVEDAAGRVNAVEVLGYLGAQKSARDRMRRIALYARCAPILNRDQNAAGVRAIVRAGGMYNLFHG